VSVHPLSERIASVLRLDPAAPAIEFDRHWHTWAEIGATADVIHAHVGPGERVAVLLRNQPEHVGLLVGLLRAGACVVAANPDRGAERVQADLAALGAGTVAGGRADLEAYAPAARWLTTDELGAVEVSGEGEPTTHDGVAVEMLTSGTTGPPTRIPLGYEMLARVLSGAKHYERNADADLRLRTGVAVIHSPLVHVGGLFRVLQCVNDGRSLCLLPRFRVEEWADAVHRHQARTSSLVPAALRMVLASDLDAGQIASLKSVISGTAPLDPADADAFYQRFGIPVLISYGATEFGGGVAGWNLVDHEKWWSTKRGSVGRAHPGCELRVVDATSGGVLGPDRDGLLEILSQQTGEAVWIRTTDLARIDPDGFLFILGRADQAIIRGGFKIQPETVKAALERDPRVLGAAVVGRAHARLGAVPVAAVELQPGAGAVSPRELLAEAARVLARYELPDELRLVDALPRTAAGKVDLAAVREMLAVPA
jgi:acyl-CoA synthetase (AMP-forming)/AMP-acid ligase II